MDRNFKKYLKIQKWGENKVEVLKQIFAYPAQVGVTLVREQVEWFDLIDHMAYQIRNLVFSTFWS